MDDIYTPHGQNITIKVEGGTPPGSGSLCKSCRHAHNIRGVNNQQRVICTFSFDRSVPITFEVAECNKYANANQPRLSDMEEIAWRIITKKGGGVVGFVDPQTFRRQEEERPAKPGF